MRNKYTKWCWNYGSFCINSCDYLMSSIIRKNIFYIEISICSSYILKLEKSLSICYCDWCFYIFNMISFYILYAKVKFCESINNRFFWFISKQDFNPIIIICYFLYFTSINMSKNIKLVVINKGKYSKGYDNLYP